MKTESHKGLNNPLWVSGKNQYPVVKVLYQLTGQSLRSGGRGFRLATMNMAAGDCHRKIEEIIMEPKEIPSCLIPRLLVVFTQQLEILVTPLSLWEVTCTLKLTASLSQVLVDQASKTQLMNPE